VSAPWRDVAVTAVREFAQDAVERSSIRDQAAQIGIGHSTLANFLNGANPHPRIRRRLGEWYLLLHGDASMPAAALAELTRTLPADALAAARRAILAALEQAHRDAGVDLPTWFPQLHEP
jgi:hypothetical protein